MFSVVYISYDLDVLTDWIYSALETQRIHSKGSTEINLEKQKPRHNSPERRRSKALGSNRRDREDTERERRKGVGGIDLQQDTSRNQLWGPF